MSRPVVLCYHAISDSWEDELAVTQAAFEQQIRTLLRRGYVAIPASGVVSSAGKTFHVTFDDAFLNIRPALEWLVAMKVPASVFACSRYADDGRPLDVERLSVLEPEYHRRTMTWDELRELVALGIEVGSHTVSHPRLTELSDADLRVELQESKQKLEDELQRRCAFLVYPFGDQDTRVRAAARVAGYSAAFGHLRPFDPFAIPRIGIYRRDVGRRGTFKLSRPGMLLATRRLARR